MSYCRDCKFWDRENKHSESHDEMKFCNLQLTDKAEFWLACGETTFFTYPDFGCVQFEEIGSDDSDS